MTNRDDEHRPHALLENTPSALVLKVGVFLHLTAPEIEALDGLETREFEHAKGQDLAVEGDEIKTTYVIVDGWLGRYRTRERTLLAEQIVRVGRRSAYERVAHLILELLHRLHLVHEADGRSYELPLTQEILGDALGLSLVHVNRTLRRLRKEGLIRMEGDVLIIDDLDRLMEIAEFDPAYLRHEHIPDATEHAITDSA
jgi:CRP-like cAMP-binding protein